MKKQTLLLMLGVILGTLNPVFAMHDHTDENLGVTSSIPVLPKHSVPFPVVDIENKDKLECKPSELHPFIQTSSGHVYRVYSSSKNSLSFNETIFYLEKLKYLAYPTECPLVHYPNYMVMQQEKRTTEKEIRFIYKGGTYEPIYLGKPVPEFPKAITFIEQEIIFEKIDKSLYPGFF